MNHVNEFQYLFSVKVGDAACRHLMEGLTKLNLTTVCYSHNLYHSFGNVSESWMSSWIFWGDIV